MPARKKTRHGFAQPAELVRQRAQFAASGAAGTHSDQNARNLRTGRTNRVGSRSSQLRAVLRFED
jgi:hypothetical protein